MFGTKMLRGPPAARSTDSHMKLIRWQRDSHTLSDAPTFLGRTKSAATKFCISVPPPSATAAAATLTVACLSSELAPPAEAE